MGVVWCAVNQMIIHFSEASIPPSVQPAATTFALPSVWFFFYGFSYLFFDHSTDLITSDSWLFTVQCVQVWLRRRCSRCPTTQRCPRRGSSSTSTAAASSFSEESSNITALLQIQVNLQPFFSNLQVDYETKDNAKGTVPNGRSIELKWRTLYHQSRWQLSLG